MKFYQASLAAGVKPLIGVDLQYRSAVVTRGVPDVCRVALLAMNLEGYRNLLKLVSDAYVGDDAHGMVDRQRNRQPVFGCYADVDAVQHDAVNLNPFPTMAGWNLHDE